MAQASSVDVDNDQLAEHLASPEFFDTANTRSSRSRPAPAGARDRVTFEGVLEVKGNRAPITLSGTITDPVSDPWGNSKLGISLAGAVDKNAVGLDVERTAPEGGSMLADEVELAARSCSSGDGERGVMRILGIAGSLRAGSLNVQLLRLTAEELPDGVELVLYDGLAEIPATTTTSRTRAGRSRRAEGGDRGGRRRARGHARVQRLRPGSAEERAGLGVPADRESPIRSKPVAVIGASPGRSGRSGRSAS